MTDATTIYHAILDNIARACERVGRDPASVTLIGVTKRQPLERVLPVLDAGLAAIGENYIQEGITRLEAIGAARPQLSLTPHFIGSLQSNKAAAAVAHFAVIHSVDRPSLARALDNAARAAGRVQQVLLQVNLGGEATKAGCEPGEIGELLATCTALTNLHVGGLMCLPPYNEDSEAVRPFFRQLRALRDQCGLLDLSMGMTHDYEIAIEEGATMVRIGTGLFGAR